MASSNPFRRRSAVPAGAQAALSAEDRFPALDRLDTSAASTPPPQTTFYDAPSSDSVSDDTRSGAKAVKKVRILSPPPLSPDSPEWPDRPQPLPSLQMGPITVDPFNSAQIDDSDRDSTPSNASWQQQEAGRTPANPFSRGPRNSESSDSHYKLERERKDEGEALKAANSAGERLDVDSFKRLLMTGNSAADDTTTSSTGLRSKFSTQEAAGALSTARQTSSYNNQEYALLGSEPQRAARQPYGAPDEPEDDTDDGNTSDSSLSAQTGRGKKPPPPPSSRHGKSILGDSTSDSATPDAPGQKPASDAYRPLPPAPSRRSLEEAVEITADRVPHERSPEADGNYAAQTSPGNVKKAVPAPPPRRGHARAESRILTGNATPSAPGGSTAARSHDEETPSRSSFDRNRHDPHSPAPPPPRRSLHVSRPSVASVQMQSTFATSVGLAMSQTSSPSPVPSSDSDRAPAFIPPQPSVAVEPIASLDGQGSGFKQAPPPPPARNTSVRRPASLRSVDSASRRTSAETKPHGSIAPPPPRPRQRGSSKGSMDGGFVRTMSSDGASMSVPSLTEEGFVAPPGQYEPHRQTSLPVAPRSGPAAAGGKGSDILADLTALQREVDALRGKLG